MSNEQRKKKYLDLVRSFKFCNQHKPIEGEKEEICEREREREREREIKGERQGHVQ
jgi:hypothetical protein